MSALAIALVRRFVYESRRCLFYCYDPKQGSGCIDPNIAVYTEWADVPDAYQSVIAPRAHFNIMIIRMKRKQARLLCCSNDKQQLNAYGWVQDWKPFRRRFGKIAEQGSMLGPYWTAPKYRRQGLYSRLLTHSIALCANDYPAIIYTSPENIASQQGIRKAGFQLMGEWEAKRWLGVISRLRRISP